MWLVESNFARKVGSALVSKVLIPIFYDEFNIKSMEHRNHVENKIMVVILLWIQYHYSPYQLVSCRAGRVCWQQRLQLGVLWYLIPTPKFLCSSFCHSVALQYGGGLKLAFICWFLMLNFTSSIMQYCWNNCHHRLSKWFASSWWKHASTSDAKV